MARSETSPTGDFWGAAQRRDSMELVMTVGGLLLSGVLVVALGWMMQEASYDPPCEGLFIGPGMQELSTQPALWHDSASPLMNGAPGR